MSGINFDKIALVAGCVAAVGGGVVLIIVGATGPGKGPIAYGVATIAVGILSFFFAQKGKPDVSINPPPDLAINKLGGVFDVPWWLWLIDLGLIGIAALIAQTVLA